MEFDSLQVEYFKKMSPGQKLEASMDLYYSARELKSAWFKKLHREWSDWEVEQAVREAFANARS